MRRINEVDQRFNQNLGQNSSGKHLNRTFGGSIGQGVQVPTKGPIYWLGYVKQVPTFKNNRGETMKTIKAGIGGGVQEVYYAYKMMLHTHGNIENHRTIGQSWKDNRDFNSALQSLVNSCRANGTYPPSQRQADPNAPALYKERNVQSTANGIMDLYSKENGYRASMQLEVADEECGNYFVVDANGVRVLTPQEAKYWFTPQTIKAGKQAEKAIHKVAQQAIDGLRSLTYEESQFARLHDFLMGSVAFLSFGAEDGGNSTYFNTDYIQSVPAEVLRYVSKHLNGRLISADDYEQYLGDTSYSDVDAMEKEMFNNGADEDIFGGYEAQQKSTRTQAGKFGRKAGQAKIDQLYGVNTPNPTYNSTDAYMKSLQKINDPEFFQQNEGRKMRRANRLNESMRLARNYRNNSRMLNEAQLNQIINEVMLQEGFFGDMWNGIKGGYNAGKQQVANSNMGQAMGNFPNNAMQGMQNMYNGAKQGLQNMGQKVAQGFQQARANSQAQSAYQNAYNALSQLAQVNPQMFGQLINQAFKNRKQFLPQQG